MDPIEIPNPIEGPEQESAYTDDEILDLTKDDPELHTEVILDADDDLDDADNIVVDESLIGKTDSALDPNRGK